jgi:hypothetical protein
MKQSIFFFRYLCTATTLFLLAVTPLSAAAATSIEPGDLARPKIGLALSGGDASHCVATSGQGSLITTAPTTRSTDA